MSGPIRKLPSVPPRTRDLIEPEGQHDVDELGLELVDMAAKRSPAGAPRDVLCLSGGGSYGAYSAGLLVGWTASGTRPAFDTVTGISTGARIAPFAFLGPKYDRQLQRFDTTLSTPHALSVSARRSRSVAATRTFALQVRSPPTRSSSPY